MVDDESNNRKSLNIGALILVIIVVFILFRVNIEKALNSPQFQRNIAYLEMESNELIVKIKNIFVGVDIKKIDTSAIIEKKIQSDKIYNYFGLPTENTINELSSPEQKK